jgi:group I intron endonuclease
MNFILTNYINLFNTIDSSTLLSIIPVVFYSNAYSDKKQLMKENKGKSGIYRWTNIHTKESYIGSAVDLSKRFNAYYSSKNIEEVLSRSESRILRAIQTHGYSNFSIEILEYCDSTETIIREQYYLDLLCPEYNLMQTAGSSLGRTLSEETKTKISNSLKGSFASEETKLKMSESRKGKVFSVETRLKLSEKRKGKEGLFLGKLHSEETKLKMSESRGSKVKVVNMETKETITYFSNLKAAKALGCSGHTIRYYIKNKKLYKGKYLFLES